MCRRLAVLVLKSYIECSNGPAVASLSMGEVSGTLSGVVIYGEIKGTRNGEGNFPFCTDVQIRKRGERTRLETSVVHAVKYGC